MNPQQQISDLIEEMFDVAQVSPEQREVILNALSGAIILNVMNKFADRLSVEKKASMELNPPSDIETLFTELAQDISQEEVTKILADSATEVLSTYMEEITK